MFSAKLYFQFISVKSSFTAHSVSTSHYGAEHTEHIKYSVFHFDRSFRLV